MLALLSEVFGKFQNTRPHITDDIRARTGICDREVKSRYRQEVAHGRNPRTHEKFPGGSEMTVAQVIFNLIASH